MVDSELVRHDAAVAALIAKCSNAGRWGSDDELGTLNHIDRSRRRQAIEAVVHGATVSLGLDLPTGVGSRPGAAVHVMLDADPLASGVIDRLTISPHGFDITHLDAVAHNFLDGMAYNGRRAEGVVTATGLTFGSVTAARDGIVTRGVLLDIAKVRGVDYLSRGDGVSVADVEAAELQAKVRVGTGDAIFIRIGTARLEAAEGRLDENVRPGILSELLPWLQEREVAVYSGDCIERLPSDLPSVLMPLHQIGQVAMGLAILDTPAVEMLRDACDRFGVSTFLLVVAPLRLPGGTGSAVNPIAIF